MSKTSSVPRNRMSRFARLGGMAGGIAGGMIAEGLRQLSRGNLPSPADLVLTPANARRVAEQLASLRGAAMKLGQLLSMDSGALLPPELAQILARLRADARPMPMSQLVGALVRTWGSDWEKGFRRFSFTPLAAASIGQVHAAVTGDGRHLALKVQYPGIRESIDSDVDNVATLLRVTRLLPRELEISPLLEEAKRQLHEEADYFAERGTVARIGQTQVQLAIDAQVRRVDQYRSRLHEAILRDTLLIDTEGRQLGQVNGLVLIQAGGHAFGSPIRISATARIGGGEVVDIQSEADLSGAVHSKGVMILSAYLANRYARHQPLSVSASLVFEQTYGQIEGDSASAAELCALLSALGDIPLKQSLAITGSINQHGQVQAIGGVCEKIEGFFEICKARGLSGNQGVIIPAVNVRDLMLHQEVVEAAQAGRFSVYAVDHVEQAMELFTGLPAGTPDANGLYPEGSINHRIQFRLAEWIALRQHYASGRPDEEQ